MATKTRNCTAVRPSPATYMVWSDLEDVFEADTAYEATSPQAAMQQWLTDRDESDEGYQAPTVLYCVVIGEHGGPTGPTFTAPVTIRQRNIADVELGIVGALIL